MKRTIIIADDNETDRDILCNYLKTEYVLIEAVNGAELIHILDEKHAQIDAVLLDIVMPIMDGFEALEKMRNSVECRNIPVVILTGETTEEMRRKAIEYGSNGFLGKPYDPYIIKKALDNVIGFRENAALIDILCKDKLTGLISHELFFEECDKLIQSHEPGFYTMSCIDIDHFKFINDQYGMEVGDLVLKNMADCIGNSCMKLGGLACRFSADKFAALYPTDMAVSSVIVDAHKQAINPSCIKHSIRIRVGRYHIKDRSLKAMVIFERATVAEESIKGRYDIYITEYDDSMRERILHEQKIVTEMGEALTNGQFIPFLQPQYNHSTGALIGAEALVRWKKADGFISPGEFIPIFEKNGFVYEVDKYIWEQVCILLKRWLDEDRKPLPVSVNISRFDLYKPDFFDTVCGLVKKYQLPADLLRLEVTESAFADSPEHIVKMVNQLIEYGFTVEIDDFGSGYSSLNTLKDVPASILKLDMKFFSETENGVRSGNIIESIVRMAKWLGMAVIAEGVEKLEQADYLKSIGCYYIQGYLYAKPMPVIEYEKLLEENNHERRLSRLQTVSTLDNEQFWNPQSMETLIFNSYVGGACIFEQHKGQLEILRVNNQYLRELSNIITGDVNLTKMNPANYMDSQNLFLLNQTVSEAVTRKEETYCELKIENSMHTIEYIRYSLRLIASTQERNLIYCVILNQTEQRTAEKKLVEAEEKEIESAQKLKIIMDNVNGGVSAIIINDDRTSQFIFSNERYYELYGYTKEQALEEHLDVMDLILPEDIDRVMETISTLKKDRKPVTIDYRIRRRDGRLALLRSMSSIMRMTGYGNEVITSVLTDITEKKSLEDQLKSIITNINGGISATVIHNGQPEFVVVNQQYFKMLGYDTREQYEEEHLDKFDMIHPDDRERVIEQFTTSNGGEKQYTMDYQIVRTDGEIRYIQNNINVIQLFGIESPVQLSISTDVTVLHEMKEKEEEAKDKLNAIINNVDNGITAVISLDGHTEFVMANDKFYEMHGLKKGDLTGLFKKVICMVHPEDRERIRDTFMKFEKMYHAVEADYRIICTDGKIRWLKVNISSTHFSGIKSPVLVTVYSDITERKERENREKILLDDLPFGAALYEYDGNQISIIHINKHYWELVERKPMDYNRISVLEMLHPADRKIAADEINSAIHQNRNISICLRIRGKENSYIPFRVTANVKKKSDGKFLLFAAYEPISQQKMNLEEIIPVILSTIMSATSELSYVKDRNLHYLCSSDSVAEMIGLNNPRDIYGKTDYDLFTKEQADILTAEDTRVVENGVPVKDVRRELIEKNGNVREISTSKYPIINSTGEVVGVLGMGREVT